MASGKWLIYDELIATVPAGAVVRNIWRGKYWLLLESSLGGFGLAQNTHTATDLPVAKYVGQPLPEVAALLKSWDFNEAALGLAAINSVHNNPGQPAGEAGPNQDAFNCFMAGIKGKKVAVVGHFPYLEKLRPKCASLIILERDPRPGDWPDSAAEYVLPEQDQVFITATAFINKTMPRLLELCVGAQVALVGPSTPLTTLLFQHGLTALSGLMVADGPAVAGVIEESRSCISLFGPNTLKVNLFCGGQPPHPRQG